MDWQRAGDRIVKLTMAELVAALTMLDGLLMLVSGLWYALTPWRWNERWQHNPTFLDRALVWVLMKKFKAVVRR